LEIICLLEETLAVLAVAVARTHQQQLPVALARSGKEMLAVQMVGKLPALTVLAAVAEQALLDKHPQVLLEVMVVLERPHLFLVRQ
jgi:hypothetical protein